MRARISLIGNDVLCECDAGDVRLPLKDWAQQYKRTVLTNDPSSLPGIGFDIFSWLDQNRWASNWVKGVGDRVLEIAVDETESDQARVLLDLPWEVLAQKGDFLAADPNQSFIVFRSIGRARDAKPAEPTHRDLAILFMAASPEGQSVLDFETEEAAILEATVRLPVQVNVEESGCADFLKDRLAQDGPFEAVHISCHGTILKDEGPMLALETPEGALDPISPGDFANLLGERKAPLVFLSACRTAENGAGVTEPFVLSLIRTGVPNVLGWDGSVYDSDAIHFARDFYGELAEHATVPFAAAKARREVLKAHRNDPNKGRHWHLARVYVGPVGAGPCCDRAKVKRKFRKEAGYKEFLDKANNRVPVAAAQEFVGRRRQAQAVLRAFRNGGQTGVLLFGMGNLGKSSLAARIANRIPKHRAVVVYERYDALAIFDQLAAVLPGSDRARWKQNWRDSIKSNGAALGNALEDMLEGPFDDKPILLIIDDLEQILEDPKPDQKITPVKDAPGTTDAWRVSLAAVLRAFKAADTESRLLLTSRYDFTLSDGKGGDLAAKLERVQLRPMEPNERAKQWRAAERTKGQAEAERDDEESALIDRALAVAGGNPGLQEILCRPILSGELAAAEKALEAVEHWKASGKVPKEENAALEFFKRVTFETYRNALTEAQRTHLRAATVFSEGLPIPITALEAVGQALGAVDPKACLSRLIGLGLVDAWEEIGGVEHAAANPLARPLAGDRLTEVQKKLLATAAMIPLANAWRNTDGNFPFDSRGVEAAWLSLLGDTPVDVLQPAALAAGIFLFKQGHNAKTALSLLIPTLKKIEKLGGALGPKILLLAANCARRVGEIGQQISLLEKGLELQTDDKVMLAQITVEHAETTITLNGPGKTLETLRNAAALFKDAADERSWAITLGKITDIYEHCGETTEALRIRREQILPIFERLSDMHQRAVTLGKIADILQLHGETDEALRIRSKEQLPVFKRLGDMHQRAITIGKIAEIHQERGEIKEALILLDEKFALLERLGAVLECAMTIVQIASIHKQHGETEEALRLLREQLPVIKRLGAVREGAVIMDRIADIFQQRGELNEALRIRRDDILPVFERLEDVRERAVILGKIADILQQQGKMEDALQIYREEELPAYKQLGDVRAQAVTMGMIAGVLQQKGEMIKALHIRRKEELPIYESLGDVRSQAMTKGKIADIFQQIGKTDEALRCYTEECLPVAKSVKDIEGIAHIRFSCAKIRLNRGGLEKGEAQTIYKELAESFTLNKKLQNADGIASVGWLLWQILVSGGRLDEALAVMDEAAAAFDKIGLTDKAAEVREMQKKIRVEKG